MPRNEIVFSKNYFSSKRFLKVFILPSATLSKRHVAFRKVTEKLDLPLNMGDFGSFWPWSRSTEVVSLAEFSSEKCQEMNFF